MRDYKGFVFDFKAIASELYRITKAGGVVVWVVTDETKKGTESGTSFRQALYFMQCGFNLHDTMIYNKGAQGGAKGSNYCYTQAFEYMFVFSKGKPKSINLLKDRENKYIKTGKSSMRKKNGKTKEFMANGNTHSKRTNVWDIRGGWMVGSTDKIAFQHPATFPEALAQDHILSWSNEGDTVLDCFCGSGTTPKMAKLLNRHYIGIDISTEYVALANERLAQLERCPTR
jgi:site-specific DNA-methyltransferase (adenine-specific)